MVAALADLDVPQKSGNDSIKGGYGGKEGVEIGSGW